MGSSRSSNARRDECDGFIAGGHEIRPYAIGARRGAGGVDAPNATRDGFIAGGHEVRPYAIGARRGAGGVDAPNATRDGFIAIIARPPR